MLNINELRLHNPHGGIFSGVTAADIALTIALVVSEAPGEQVLKPTY